MKIKLIFYIIAIVVLLFTFSLYIAFNNKNTDDGKEAKTAYLEKNLKETEKSSVDKTQNDQDKLSRFKRVLKNSDGKISDREYKAEKRKHEKIKHAIELAEKKIAEIDEKIAKTQNLQKIKALQDAKEYVKETVSRLMNMQ